MHARTMGKHEPAAKRAHGGGSEATDALQQLYSRPRRPAAISGSAISTGPGDLTRDPLHDLHRRPRHLGSAISGGGLPYFYWHMTRRAAGEAGH